MDEDQDKLLIGKCHFNETEKLYLMSLIEQVSDIIECTKTDGASVIPKENAWTMITEEYANGYKTAQTLCRKSDSAEKQYKLKTGGGKPLSSNPEEEINNKLRAMVSTINFTLENPWDSTSQLENNFDSKNYDCEFLDENLLENEDSNIECTYSGDLNVNVSERKNQCREKVSLKKDYTINNTVEEILKKQPRIPSSISRRNPLIALENRPSTSLKYDILGKRLEKVSDSMIDGTSNEKKKFTSANEIDSEIRVQRNEEARTQQRDLHEAKIEVIKKESEYWQKMIESASLEKTVYATQLKAEQTRLLYWKTKSSAYNSRLDD